MSKLRLTAAAALAALAIAPVAGAAELVTNGNFEAGNAGFNSDYGYRVGNFWDEGTYGIDDNPHDGHALFSSYGDHTTGTGLMMVINGMGTENAVVWGQDVFAVAANADYTFSFWMASAHPDSPAQLAARINGSWQSPVAMATSDTGVWTQYSYTWNSGSATTANIALVNRNLAWQGNDFTLDDISFKGPAAVPEPATWAMMIIGFGSVGAVIRRRRTVAAAI